VDAGRPGLIVMKARTVLYFALSWWLLVTGLAWADSAGEALTARYQALRPQLETNVYGVPIHIESAEDGELRRGEVYGVLTHSFPRLSEALRNPREWCEIALLHLNIKTCTHEKRDGADALTFYSGRKFYEPPEKAYVLRYAFRVDAARTDYLAVTLTAPSGPLGTSDYLIAFEAIPLGQATFVHFRYAYRPSLTSSFATGGYLATLGSGKVGFTVTGRDRQGRSEHIGGVRGIVERNAMRYYLAIQAYFETRDKSSAQRFERWFDLTERYPVQLHELEKPEYLQYKLQERRQQDEHQRALDAAAR